MRLYEVTTPGKCPRTKAKVCECKSVNQLTEAEKTIEAVAVLGHGDAKGMISFKQKPGKATIISGTVTGLSEGKHGFHIHEFGDLSDGCDSAGGHYNPTGVDHGDIDNGHVGDLGNIIADSKGVAKFSIKAKRINLQGPTSIVGRAVVVHEDEDDLGKGGDEESLKTGNAGNRAGCGVISLTELTESELGDLDKNISDKHFSRSEMPQVKEPDLKDLDIPYKKGKISIANIKPVQTDRVPGLAQKVAKNFYGKDKPFILDKNNYLVNGHHRYDAARLLGIEKVDAIKVDVPIELLMQKFSHTTSDTAVENINEYGVPDYNTMPTYKLKKAHKGKQKFFLPSNEPTPKGVQAVEDVVGMNPHAKKPYFTPKEADQANYEWINQAQVDQEDGVIIKGTDGNQYRIMTSYGNQHFEDGEVYLDGVTDPQYLDIDGYPDAAELLYYHSATGHYPDDEEEVEENFADGKKKGKSKPGRVKRSGASCKGSVTSLRAKAKKYSGERGKMYHWCANMKGGKKKKKTNEGQTTTDYVDTKQFGDYIKQHGGTDKVAVKVLSALQVFQDKSRDIFYKVEAESGYSVNGKSLDKSLIRKIVPKRIPDDVVGIWIAKNISPKGTKLKPNWSWREDPKAFTQHPDMIKLRKVVQDHIQKALTDSDVPITIQHFDQDEEMAPQFRLNIQTNEGTKKTNEGVFDQLPLPTWMSHTSLEKMFAQEYGPRYGDYVAHMELDSDDELAMTASGEMGDIAFEMVKANDIRVMQKFLSQMPVQFTVDDLKLDQGIQVWHLVQQNKSVH